MRNGTSAAVVSQATPSLRASLPLVAEGMGSVDLFEGLGPLDIFNAYNKLGERREVTLKRKEGAGLGFTLAGNAPVR